MVSISRFGTSSMLPEEPTWGISLSDPRGGGAGGFLCNIFATSSPYLGGASAWGQKVSSFFTRTNAVFFHISGMDLEPSVSSSCISIPEKVENKI